MCSLHREAEVDEMKQLPNKAPRTVRTLLGPSRSVWLGVTFSCDESSGMLVQPALWCCQPGSAITVHGDG